MKRLRKQTFDSGIPNEERGGGRRWTRIVYLALLAVFGLALVRVAFGDYLVLRGEGIVLRDRVDVGVEYNATIQAVYVEEGQNVERGEPIFALRSLDATRTLIQLQREEIELDTQLTMARAEARSLPRLIELAEERYATARSHLVQLQELYDDNLVANDVIGLAIDREFRAKQELEEAIASYDEANLLIENLGETIGRLRRVIEDFSSDYDGGTVSSPVDGQIGPVLPYPGTVIEPGTHAVSVLTGRPYVLAYIPTGTLFSVDVGDDVTVFAGTSSFEGRIETISSFARSVPQELLDSLGRPERKRVLRIQLNEDAPPVFSTVTVRYSATAWLPL